MLKETETEETIRFVFTFLSLVAFQLGRGGGALGPPGYAYDTNNPNSMGIRCYLKTMGVVVIRHVAPDRF